MRVLKTSLELMYECSYHNKFFFHILNNTIIVLHIIHKYKHMFTYLYICISFIVFIFYFRVSFVISQRPLASLLVSCYQQCCHTKIFILPKICKRIPKFGEKYQYFKKTSYGQSRVYSFDHTVPHNDTYQKLYRKITKFEFYFATL